MHPVAPNPSPIAQLWCAGTLMTPSGTRETYVQRSQQPQRHRFTAPVRQAADMRLMSCRAVMGPFKKSGSSRAPFNSLSPFSLSLWFVCSPRSASTRCKAPQLTVRALCDNNTSCECPIHFIFALTAFSKFNSEQSATPCTHHVRGPGVDGVWPAGGFVAASHRAAPAGGNMPRHARIAAFV